MKTKICYIIGAGSVDGIVLRPETGDYVIAADGGFSHVEKLKVKADLVLGDFDSLPYIPDHPNIVRHSSVKNDTDMMLCAKSGLELGYITFVLYGGVGGRLDHTLANLQMLAWLSRRGKRAFLVGEGIVITAVTNGTLFFDEARRGTISVFCSGDKAVGVNLEGLKYPLTDATLSCDVPLGVSNEFTGGKSVVSVREGTLIVLWKYTPKQLFGELL